MRCVPKFSRGLPESSYLPEIGKEQLVDVCTVLRLQSVVCTIISTKVAVPLRSCEHHLLATRTERGKGSVVTSSTFMSPS